MPKRIILAAALLLSACGGGEAGGNSAGGNGSDDAAGSVVEETPANLQDDPNNMVVPLTAPAPTPSASAGPVAALPTTFRGRWGMVAKDCDPAFDYAAKGLMVVAADSLKFYESRGRIEQAAAIRPGTFRIDLAYAGEGQTWHRRETLTLLDDGRTLVREEQEPAGSFRYSKCPAGRETPVDQRGA